MKEIAAIILAAGKGKRMKSKKFNKVVAPLGSRQYILHVTENLEKMNIAPIIVVVGFAKESVMQALGNRMIYALQSKRLGTAHAVSCALKKVPDNIKTVLVLNGDDSAFYTQEVIRNLIVNHFKNNAALSFLTITVNNPAGLGRVIRNNKNEIIKVAEEKDAEYKEKEIREINPGCYMFKIDFLRKYLNKIKKSPISGEYYLTSLINIALENREKVEAMPVGEIPWRGINTEEELKEAEKIFAKIK